MDFDAMHGKFWIIALLAGLAAVTGAAGDLRQTSYVSPGGSGNRSGADADNAASSLAAAWAATAPGGTVFVAAGRYKGQSLVITADNGGREGEKKRIRGVAEGENLPLFTGDWDRNDPAEGRDFISLRKGASHIEIRGIRVEDYRVVVAGSGDNDNLQFRELALARFRDGIYLNGGSGIEISGCRMNGFTKRAVRLMNGVTDAEVKDTVADAGGREFATERFQICFGVGGGKEGNDSNIRFDNCTARNAYDDAGDKYWNADGFCAESGTSSITWKNCRAFHCTDGGWDIKTRDALLIDCVAFGNKRNFRIWGNARMVNCIAGFAKLPGGSGTAAGLHVCGNIARVEAERCTFIGNRIAIDADQRGAVLLKECIIALVDEKALTVTTEPAAKVEGLDSCRISRPEETQKLFPGVAGWNGIGKDFDAPVGESAGYRSR